MTHFRWRAGQEEVIVELGTSASATLHVQGAPPLGNADDATSVVLMWTRRIEILLLG